MLFICGGAFEGLFDIAQNKSIGFMSATSPKQSAPEPLLNPESLVKYGLMPEFITKEYQLLFDKDGVRLTFEEDALREVARLAITKKTGARGLRAILEDVMLDIMYELPDSNNIRECIITKESITTKEPVLVKKRGKRQASAT